MVAKINVFFSIFRSAPLFKKNKTAKWFDIFKIAPFSDFRLEHCEEETRLERRGKEKSHDDNNSFFF